MRLPIRTMRTASSHARYDQIATLDSASLRVSRVNVAIRLGNLGSFAMDARVNAEIISLTRKALPNRVSGKPVAAKVRHKTNDLFVPIYGIGLAPSKHPLTSGIVGHSVGGRCVAPTQGRNRVAVINS